MLTFSIQVSLILEFRSSTCHFFSTSSSYHLLPFRILLLLILSFSKSQFPAPSPFSFFLSPPPLLFPATPSPLFDQPPTRHPLFLIFCPPRSIHCLNKSCPLSQWQPAILSINVNFPMHPLS